VKSGVRIAIASALCLAAPAAFAHGSAQGLGDFLSGVLHPLMDPAHGVALAALALWIGRLGLAGSHPAVPGFSLGLVTGLMIAGLAPLPDTPVPLLAVAALTGLAVMVARPLPPFVGAALALLIGAGIGLGSAPEGLAGPARWVMLAGTAVGAHVWLFNGAGLVQAMRRPWLQVLARVFGSWVTASALLVLALAATGRG